MGLTTCDVLNLGARVGGKWEDGSAEGREWYRWVQREADIWHDPLHVKLELNFFFCLKIRFLLHWTDPSYLCIYTESKKVKRELKWTYCVRLSDSGLLDDRNMATNTLYTIIWLPCSNCHAELCKSSFYRFNSLLSLMAFHRFTADCPHGYHESWE